MKQQGKKSGYKRSKQNGQQEYKGIEEFCLIQSIFLLIQGNWSDKFSKDKDQIKCPLQKCHNALFYLVWGP